MRTADAEGAPTVGARLRTARRARGLTIEQVASSAGMTKSFISRVERDQASASVASLVRLCDVLRIKVGSLFDDADASEANIDSAPAISFGGHRVHDLLLTPSTQRSLLVVHSTVEPRGGSGDEAYVLGSETEFVYVLEGSLEIVVDGISRVLDHGSALTFSARAPHTWRNPSPTDQARALWVLTPAV